MMPGIASKWKVVVRPEAIQVMREIRIDISNHRSKHLDEFDGQHFDYVLTVCDNANERAQFGPLHLDILEIPIKRLPFGSKVLHSALSYFDRQGACFPSQASDERRTRSPA
jgi:hypothetical protein